MSAESHLPRPSPVEWLCLVAGLFLVVHYAWLLDDAFVYFKYVDNWVLLGRGLVYNPGEFAEGYTSPAWLLLLAGLRSLGIGFWLAVQILGALCFALFWLLALWINRALSPPNRPSVNLPVAFLSLNYAVLCYFSSGTEGPLVQLAAAVFVFFVLRPTWKPALVLVPLLPLVRPELALALVAALVWYRLKTRRMPWLLAGIAGVLGGGWLLFRVLYYADLFPTTFYLKNIVDVRQGLLFLHDTFRPYHLYELILLGVVALALAARRTDRRSLALDARAWIALVVVAELLYTVKIGGDPRHYRYLAFPVCASVLGLGGIAETWLGLWESTAPESRRRWIPGVGLAAALFLAALSFGFYPRQLERHPAVAPRGPAKFVDKIADAVHHRRHPAVVSPAPWTLGEEIELRPAYARWRSAGGSDPPTQIRIGGICYPQYVHFDQWAVQSYGLTDAILARVDVPSDRPAHKEGLVPLSGDLARVMQAWGRPPAPGMYRAAVEAGTAAPWIGHNLASIERIERKIYNRHALLENLDLALHGVERIQLPEPRDQGPARGPSS